MAKTGSFPGGNASPIWRSMDTFLTVPAVFYMITQYVKVGDSARRCLNDSSHLASETPPTALLVVH